ncbi:ABC-type transport auxiliary lipoprotein family protein [Microbulbifer sp. ALW1]|uniref:ABC-type transport auxiliary lipoprotein family protein n=1 Tax=Microbulbifer sp. (strain ALW1) TaxID=1516059 RepID=UPI001357BD14|nr:ABC-type transport auxiliary lipoprotein family protein [Microbulbifer sp. ALW1]
MSENGSASTLSQAQTICRLLLAIAVMFTAGCTLFSPVENDIRVAVIDKIPVERPQQQNHSATLLVLPTAINPVYDTIRMAYQTQPHQIDYFSRHQWGATPAQMLLPLLAQTLENTHYFKAVTTPPYFGPYNYGLRTEILEFIQDFTATPTRFHLSLRIQLVDGTSNRIIASRVITVREPMIQDTPVAGVVAANDASANALQQAAQFVLEQVP